MPFLRKKLLLKFIMAELILLGISEAIRRLWPELSWLPLVVLVGLNVILFFVMVSHPFNKVLREFKALLTGKNYNRIYTKKIDEIGVVAHFFNEITKSLERVSKDIKAHRRISSELSVAQKIQKDLLPQSTPDIVGLDIVAKTKPAAEIGGDSFDFITKGDRTFLYVGDVTGHGIPAGLVMMIVDTLVHTFSDMVETSKQLMVQANKYLKPRIQSTMFMTMVMLRWEHRTQEMFYTGAGHETILHYRALDQKLDNLKSGGIALGMVPDNTKLIEEKGLHLNEGDFVILYTDGITEARNTDGELFGIDRLKKIIEKQAPKASSAEILFKRISTELTHFLGEAVQLDDMTMIVMRKGKSQILNKEESTEWSGDENKGGLIPMEKSDALKESGLKGQDEHA